MTEQNDWARYVNLRVPAMLTAALAQVRAYPHDLNAVEVAQSDFASSYADAVAGAHPELVAWAITRYAVQIIDALAESTDVTPVAAEEVIQHFARTYNASIEGED